MNCEQVKELLHAYLDKQLDAAHALMVEKHLSHCLACKLIYDNNAHFHSTLQKALPYYSAPQELRINILKNLSNSTAPTIKHTTRNWHRISLGLTFAASLILGVVLINVYHHQQNESELIESILSSHINALTTNRLTDIQSSQAEKLIPWLTSKLDYSPKVYNLSQQGYKLIGARLDSLHKQRIASLIYQYNHRVINLYTWPSPDIDDAAQESHQQQGYQLIYWCQSNMNYWVVSDMDAHEAEEFAKLFKQHLNTVKN